MNKNLTELVFIVDRSGSMGGLETDTIGGINATLAKNRAIEGEAIVSIVLFDTSQDTIVDRVPIGQVRDLTSKDYQVRGCTALLDCVGDTIAHIERVQGYMPEEHKADHVLFVITTDGYENASCRHSYEDVKRSIQRHTEEGWEFLFLGANIDAIEEAGRLGIHQDRAATYLADSEGSQIMFSRVSQASCEFRTLGSIGGTWKRAIEDDTKARG